MDKTQVVTCTCKHEAQDSFYGNGMRATTPNNKEQSSGHFVVRCTVCAKEHNIGKVK